MKARNWGMCTDHEQELMLYKRPFIKPTLKYSVSVIIHTPRDGEKTPIA